MGGGLHSLDFELTLASLSREYQTIAHNWNYIVVGAQDKAPAQVGSGPVTISAACPGALVQIDNPEIASGMFAELAIIPTGEVIGELNPGGGTIGPHFIVTVTITGTRGGISHTVTQAITVFTGYSWGAAVSGEGRQLTSDFVQWLSVNQPQLGITEDSSYVIYPVVHIGPQWPNEEWLYFSEEWELALSRMTVGAPADSFTIALRRRYIENDYSLCFHINSISAQPPEDFAPFQVPHGLVR